MANIQEKIYSALCDHLEGLTFTPALPISYPNVDFKPPAGDYIEVVHLTNETETANVSGGAYHYKGIFQVSVWVRKGAGIVKGLRIAGEILHHFEFNTAIANDGFYVKIERQTSIASPLQEGERIQIPVTIRYRATN
jgi:hypothetical protein